MALVSKKAFYQAIKRVPERIHYGIVFYAFILLQNPGNDESIFQMFKQKSNQLQCLYANLSTVDNIYQLWF